MASVQELSGKYSSQLSQLKGIFPSWDEGDLVFTLQDARGNVEEAAMMITDGRASQFTQATRKKPVKTASAPSKGFSNRNADTGGWEAVNGQDSLDRGMRGGRGGRGGARGGRGGRGGEPFRGGRGGRGGFRGGRGGFANASTSTSTKKDDTTTTDGWAKQVAESTAEDATAWGSTTGDVASTIKPDEDAGWADSAAIDPAPVETGQAEDFSAAGGWGDAPAPKEIESAAKAGGKDWQEDYKKDLPTEKVAPTTGLKPKMTWAQIAKPQEKPKPIPPPAPVAPKEPEPVEPEPVVELEEPTEPIEAFGDAPAPKEIEEQAAHLDDTQPEAAAEEEEQAYTNGHAEEDLLPEESAPQPEEDEWQHDPAIAGTGAPPQWAEPSPAAPEPVLAPEPITTYTGPPGFNTVASKSAAAVGASQPRTNSRAGRYKNADGQGVVLPAAASGMSAMEMQFGSLSFGGELGDGVEAPPHVEAPKAAPEPVQAPVASQVTSPIRAPQPPPVVQPPVPTQPLHNNYYSQPPSQPAPSTTTQSQQPSYGGYGAPPSLSQYQPYGQQQQPQQPSAQAAAIQQPTQPTAQEQQSYYSNYRDFYSNLGSQPQQAETAQSVQHQQQGHQAQQHLGHQQQQQAQQQQQQQQQQQHSNPYDAYGGFGGHAGFGAQSAQHTPANDHGAHRQSYDSYAASGYPRPSLEEPKSAAPAPSHTPTAPAQPQQGLQHQQSQYYSQLGNMGYPYQAAPYNPYYQYGQAAPQPGYQQYYPLAARNLYGNAPNTPQPLQHQQSPNPPPASKPSPAPIPSPYSYNSTQPSQTQQQGEDQYSFTRYGEKPSNSLNSSQAGVGGYGSSASTRPGVNGVGGAGAGDDKSLASTSSVGGGRPGQQPQGQGQVQGQGQGQGFGGGAGGVGGYQSYGGGGGYGGQDWSQYGQQGGAGAGQGQGQGGQGHYGARNGYSHWQ